MPLRASSLGGVASASGWSDRLAYGCGGTGQHYSRPTFRSGDRSTTTLFAERSASLKTPTFPDPSSAAEAISGRGNCGWNIKKGICVCSPWFCPYTLSRVDWQLSWAVWRQDNQRGSVFHAVFSRNGYGLSCRRRSSRIAVGTLQGLPVPAVDCRSRDKHNGHYIMNGGDIYAAKLERSARRQVHELRSS